MLYKVISRNWESDYTKRFGDYGSLHELSDTEVVEAIIQFGRAEIDSKTEPHELHFQNEYD